MQYDINRDSAKISALSSRKNGLIGISYTWGNIKFKYSPLGKASEKQRRKQVDASKSLNFSNKIDELKQIESIFP